MVATWACLLVLFLAAPAPKAAEVHREKRHLIYPEFGSKVQFIVGTGVPIPSDKHAVTMGWVLKAKYILPTNATEYTDSYVTFQKRSVQRPPSRYDLYRLYEVVADRFGGGGKECTLRSICETSRIPFKASGLLSQMLRIFFLPSSTDETPLTRSDMDYHSAELLGKENDLDCKVQYPSCSFTLIDWLTVIM